MLKRPTREPRPPARRAYFPEGTEKSPSSLDQEGLCKGLKYCRGAYKKS
ncbi:MAG: hypothetical protein ACQEQO_07600 [Thermodesulfobacteriota bacterium]